MFWMLLRAPWLIAALLVNAVTLLAQRDSATTRVVPVWRDGQLVTRVSGDPSVAGAPYVIRIWNFDNQIVLPHTHPEDEHIVVVQGTWFLAEGDVSTAVGSGRSRWVITRSSRGGRRRGGAAPAQTDRRILTAERPNIAVRTLGSGAYIALEMGPRHIITFVQLAA